MDLLVVTLVTALIYMTCVFLVALEMEDNSIVDVAWGGGFILISCVSLVYGGVSSGRQVLVPVLTCIWGLRLLVHIYSRHQRRQGEDFRYRAWRERWGKWFLLRSYFQIFLLQGLVMVIIATPLLVVAKRPGAGIGILDVLGTIIWSVGFCFEAISDWQLTQFKKVAAKKGAIMTGGLWRFSRHPNYFGEALLWWGILLIVSASPNGWWAIVSPITITFLLIKVSGVPMLEKRYASNEEFAEYCRRTHAFFPWFSKKPAETTEYGI